MTVKLTSASNWIDPKEARSVLRFYFYFLSMTVLFNKNNRNGLQSVVIGHSNITKLVKLL